MFSAVIFYKEQFLVQLLLAEGVFCCRLERKSGFWRRAAFCLILLATAAALLPAAPESVLLASLQYLLLFLCSAIALCFCFDEPPQNLLFCGIAGYTIQQLAYLLFTFMNEFAFSGIDELGLPVVDPYSSAAPEVVTLDPVQLLLYWVINGLFYVVIYYVVYITAFDLFDPVIRSNHDLHLGRAGTIAFSGLLIFADVIFSRVTAVYTAPQSVWRFTDLLYNSLLCIMILALLYSQLSQRALKDELVGVQYILEQSKQQYAFAKNAADLINIKYHDLRHQSQRFASSEEKAELEHILSDYDQRVQTGNEVLDVILTEKNIVCRQKDIQLLCMADGRGLEFIKPHHLYSLLSNAIENAIEAVEPLPAEERIINFYLRRQGTFYHLRIENPCGHPVTLRDGMPVTHKTDKNLHGFGMLSMKTIAEQYGGGLSVRMEDGLFCMDVILSDEAQA